AVNLVFVQHNFDLAVQAPGRIQIVSERLLDHNAPPASILLVRQTGSSQLLDNGREKLGCGRQIEQVVALDLALPIQVAEPIAEGRIGLGIREVPALVVEPLREPLPSISAAILGGQEAGYLVTKLFEAQVIDRNANDSEVLRQQLCLHQVEKRRNQLPLG